MVERAVPGGASRGRVWLGTAALGRWGNADQDACVELVRHALDRGVDVVDTADVYSEGDAETIVGRAVEGRRDEVAIATKFGYRAADVRAADVVGAVDASLARLRTDRIDLYQIHRLSGASRLEEVLDTLEDLRLAGKVLAVGTSTFRPDVVVECQWSARAAGRVPPRSEQAPCSIFVREIERGLLDVARRHDVDVIGYAPLNGGWLTGKYRRGTAVPAGSRASSWPVRGERYDFSRPSVQRKLELVDRLADLAEEAGLELAHLALGFSLSHPDVRAIILGVRDLDQLDALLPGVDVRLDASTLDRIDEIVPPGETVDREDLAGYDSPDLVDRAVRRVPCTASAPEAAR